MLYLIAGIVIIPMSVATNDFDMIIWFALESDYMPFTMLLAAIPLSALMAVTAMIVKQDINEIRNTGVDEKYETGSLETETYVKDPYSQTFVQFIRRGHHEQLMTDTDFMSSVLFPLVLPMMLGADAGFCMYSKITANNYASKLASYILDKKYEP